MKHEEWGEKGRQQYAYIMGLSSDHPKLMYADWAEDREQLRTEVARQRRHRKWALKKARNYLQSCDILDEDRHIAGDRIKELEAEVVLQKVLDTPGVV